MTIIFGNLTKDFTTYLTPGTTMTKDQFMDKVNTMWCVCFFNVVHKQ